jgi:lysophospholipase L1-like esterase
VKAKTVAFIGDSYAAGAGTSAPPHRWTTRVSLSLGWDEENVALGGTGYLASSTDRNGTVRPNYEAVIAKASQAKPVAVIVSGGRNDVGLPIESVEASVQEFYTSLRAALPKATIIAISPVWDASQPPAELAQVAAAVQAAVQEVGGTYLDVGQPLAGKPDLITGDKVHPNDQGAAKLADAVRTAILKSKVAAALTA